MLSAVRLYRFGPYELDAQRNELRKFGVRLKLERKPLQLLLMLLQRGGEVAKRSELQTLLWSEGVFVDFEKGLNVAVTKLRAALNDSSETPKYIETVAGEGYRFIAQVERVFPGKGALASAPSGRELPTPEPPQPGDGSSLEPGTAQAAPAAPGIWRSWRKWRQVSVAAAVVVVSVLAVLAATVNSRRFRPTEQAHARKIMLVVLPFENLSGDPSLEYLSDGITEELSEQLGNLNPQGLGVIGRTSAMTYKHSSRTIGQIGSELRVGYVLEGSVRREGEKLRVTAQLVKVSDQAHVWAADYDRSVRGLVQLEDDIAQQITRQVGVSVALDSPGTAKRHTPDPEAHQAYLLGRFYWNKRTVAGYRSGEQYFRRAIQLDPQYAAAYAGLAESGIPIPEAKAAALKAVELDPSSGEARTALGWIELFREVDVSAAERTLKMALELDPNYATAHHWYAFVLEATGRLQEARAEITEAARLDPLSLIIRSALAGALSEAGQQDAALAQLKLVFEMDPHFPKAHEELGRLYERKRMYEAAIHEYELSSQNGGDPLWADRGYVYAISGHKQEALSVLARLQELEKRSAISPLDLALVNVGLGRKQEAIAWLQKASLEPDDGLLELKADPRFDPLRSDPRFQDLLRRMKFS